MNDLVDRSRLTKRFSVFEPRLCILQERARHSKSPPDQPVSSSISLFSMATIKDFPPCDDFSRVYVKQIAKKRRRGATRNEGRANFVKIKLN